MLTFTKKYTAMRLLACCLLLLFCCCFSCTEPAAELTGKDNKTTITTDTTQRAEYALVIHGGAGTIRKSDLSEEKEAAIRAVLDSALATGEAVLQEGGSALDAVERTIHILEDSPFFNAGKGAVFTHAGINELDASIMDGSGRAAGAVGGVTNLRHPISAARAVMEQSEHVLLTGRGAEEFAAERGLEIVDPAYFYTEDRRRSLDRILEEERQTSGPTGLARSLAADHKFGTVGCVALDKTGNIAAGTSTGGMTNKRWNRIGDSPIIGAGTFADNTTCGVSCTGHGEFFIRYAVAYDLSARMEYMGEDLRTAANYIINDKLKKAGGSGGFVALDRFGNIAMPFNTEGMYRGYARPGERVVEIYGE